MDTRTLLLLVVLGLTTGVEASGQVLVTGTVEEAETWVPLVSATLQIKGTLVGTVTNRDGRFSLPVARLPAEIVVRHIGYRSQSIRLSRAPTGPLSILLEPDPVVLDELVVSGEDPGVGIMRSVLRTKAAWRDSISTAYAEVYSRFFLYREFDLVQVEETIRRLLVEGGPRRSGNHSRSETSARAVGQIPLRRPATGAKFLR